MRIIVTGATSMLGCALIDECTKKNTEVMAIVRKGSLRENRIPASPLVHIVHADIDDLDKIEYDGREYDALYHFAWGHTSKLDRNLATAQEKNIRDTLLVADFAAKFHCKKFVFAGSQAEYGSIDGVITPDTNPKPITAYGMAKLSAGMLSRLTCEQNNITHIWTRIFSVYGIRDQEWTMIKYAIDSFSKGVKASFSAGTQMWNYLYETDAGKMFYLLGEKDVSNGIYHIASADTRPLREYIEQICDVWDKNVVDAGVKSDAFNVMDNAGVKSDAFDVMDNAGVKSDAFDVMDDAGDGVKNDDGASVKNDPGAGVKKDVGASVKKDAGASVKKTAVCEFGTYDSKNKIVGIQPDISETVKAIGFVPEVSFEQGISNIIDWKM
ncbi:MAG: NAD-dependent epimerase/dehydratase family protein [Butyrivibrio sp.]|nr:NAD-dependent epimerase/dehydratase family protein [Butyrivibrio sp.]